LSLGLFAGTANASVQATYSNSATVGAYLADISSSDLVNTGQPTYAGGSMDTTPLIGSFTALTDGTGSTTDTSKIMFKNAGWPTTLTFNLNVNPATGGSANGYNISKIQTIGGWTVSFVDQRYTVWVKTVGSSSYVQVGGNFYDSTVTGATNSTKTVITDSTGTLASNVQSIQLVYSAPVNGSAGVLALQEVDIIGKAVPLYFDTASNTVWDIGTTSDWSTAPGGPYTSLWSNTSDATFEGTAGTVNVASTIGAVNSLTFTTDGYQLGSSAGSGTITLSGAGGDITTGAGTDTIDSVVAGSVGLTKLGTGTLTLAAGTAASGTYTGYNTFSGAVNVSAGTLLLAPTPHSPNDVIIPALFHGIAVAGNNVTIASGATLKAGTGTKSVFNGIQNMTINGTLDCNSTSAAEGSNFGNGIGSLSGNGVIANASSATLYITGSGADATFSGTFGTAVANFSLNQCNNAGNSLRGGIQILNIGGGSGSATFGNLNLGAGNQGESALKLIGGTLTVNGLNMSSNSNGQMLVDGGTLNVNTNYDFRVGNYGWDGHGQVRFVQTGGTVNLLGTGGACSFGMHYYIGNLYWEPSDAMTFSGGTFTSSRPIMRVSEGDPGTATTTNPGRPSFFTVSGTAAVTIPSFNLGANQNGCFAQFDLNGGTLSTGSFTKAPTTGSTNGYMNTGIVNFNGGTLKATASGQMFTGFTPGSNTVPLKVQSGTVDVYKLLNTANGGNINIIGLSDGLNVKTGGAIIDTNAKAVAITPALTGTPGDGGLTVKNTTGTGTLTLAGTNTYYGNTTIQNSSTLALTGTASIANSPVIDIASGAHFDVSGLSSTISLGAGQTLQGTGTVTGPMLVSGTVSPGYVAGDTMNVGSTTISGHLAVKVDGNSTELISSGTLNLTGGTVDVTVVVGGGGGGFTQPYYVIASASSITGSLPSVNSTYKLTNTGTQLQLSLNNSFATWIAGYTVSDSTPAGNPSHDGLSNLVKYALGLNPTVSAQPAGTLSSGTLTFSKGDMAQGDSNLTYSIEESTDLVTWTTPTGTSPSGTVSNAPTYISYSFPTGQSKVFARLKVVQTP